MPLLVADGHEVTVMIRRDGPPREPFASGVRMVRADLFVSLARAVRAAGER